MTQGYRRRCLTHICNKRLQRSQITLINAFVVFVNVYYFNKRHPEILMGSTRSGASNKGGVGKQATFYSFKRQYLEHGRRFGQSY